MLTEDIGNGWVLTMDELGTIVTEGLMTKADHANMVLANVQNRLALVRESVKITGFTHISCGNNWREAFGGTDREKGGKPCIGRVNKILDRILG